MNSASTLSHSFTSPRVSWRKLWEKARAHWRFKFTLPRLQTLSLEGVRLDVSSLSSLMKNNLLFGRYEVQERRLVERFLTREDAVLELGGAIGFIGLFCQIRLGITQYTTVEANPATVELLKRNYALNGLTPEVWNLALAAENGEIALNVGSEFWENSTLASPQAGRRIQVPAQTLGSMIRQLHYAPTALIIDIEGAEMMINFHEVPASVKKIIIELHPKVLGRTQTCRIVATLINLGFRLEHEEDGTYLFQRS